MGNELVILHRPKGGRRKLHPSGLCERWIAWETCLRQVYFGVGGILPEALPDDFEVYRGEDAYRFCLRVVCGLNSPIVGETEVWGQFRGIFKQFDYSGCGFGSELRRFVESIFADAKLVRHRHLSGLGSQSYGSLARRLLKGQEEINLIGSGSLVKDMLPWLLKSAKVLRLICRRPDEGQKLLAELCQPVDHVQVVQLYGDSPVKVAGSVVVAAPVEKEKIHQCIELTAVEKVIDLRDNSQSDSIEFSGETILLNDFFQEMEKTREILAQRVESANHEIENLVVKRFGEMLVRPLERDYVWT